MADRKISELDAVVQVTSDDLIIIVDNPTGTPVNKKITIKNLFSDIPANTVFAANVDVSGSFEVSNNELRIEYSQTPANSTITKAHGNIFWDANYIYVATANNNLKRVALSSF